AARLAAARARRVPLPRPHPPPQGRAPPRPQGDATRLPPPHRIFAARGGVSAKLVRVGRRKITRPIVSQFTASVTARRNLAGCPGMEMPWPRDGGDKEDVS